MEVSVYRIFIKFLFVSKFISNLIDLCFILSQDYSEIKATRIINAEIVNTLGNLVSRICAPAINKRQIVPVGNLKEIKDFEHTSKLIKKLKKLPSIYEEHFESYNFYLAIDEMIATLHTTNNLVQETQPWMLVKDPAMSEQLDAVLALVFESIRINAILLQPIIPNIAQKILDKINISVDRRRWEDTQYQLDAKQNERPLSDGSSKIMDRLKK